MVKPETCFIDDQRHVMVADNPEEPNLVREYVPAEPVATARALARDLESRSGFAAAKRIVELLNEALGD